ncbi:MAG: membrane protease subunit HflK [Halieaceae bacterium]|jgi:membrane protease subunit HflK
MAWNEPGGNGGGKKDPWGGGDQGPPDLDEALRKLQEKIGGLFGGGSNSGGSGSGGDVSGVPKILIGAALVVALLAWGLMGFYQIDQQERGVVLRFGKYYDTVMPGLQWNPPLIDEVFTVNVTKVRSSAHREQMLTEDQNIVEVDLSVQYTVVDVQKFVLKVRDPERSLQHATESALRHVVGSSLMYQVLTEGREQIAIDVHARLQSYLDNYETGIQVSQVNIENTAPPPEVQEAFDDVIKAKEDEERVKNEAQAYSNGIIPEARGQAQRQLEEASAYKEQVTAQAQGEAQRFERLLNEYSKAPKVTRERLYIDALQDVLSSTSKVMIDVEGGNNLMYLPLDKIVGQASSLPAGGSIGQQGMRDLANRVAEQLRQDSSNSSRREGR